MHSFTYVRINDDHNENFVTGKMWGYLRRTKANKTTKKNRLDKCGSRESIRYAQPSAIFHYTLHNFVSSFCASHFSNCNSFSDEQR